MIRRLAIVGMAAGVGVLSAGVALGAEASPAREAAGIVEHMAKGLAAAPEQVSVSVSETKDLITLELDAAAEDFAAIDGEGGANRAALEALLAGIAKKCGKPIGLVVAPLSAPKGPAVGADHAAREFAQLASASGNPPRGGALAASRLTGVESVDDRIYTVVMNHEEQYSIWPHDRIIPRGWTSVGRTGTRAECLDYIKEVMVDRYNPRRPPPQATMTTAKVGDVTILKVLGKLTAGQGSVTLPRAVERIFQEGGRKVIVNLEAVTTVGNGDFGELLIAQTTARRSGGDLRVCCPQEQVRKDLETYLGGILRIFKTEAEALASF